MPFLFWGAVNGFLVVFLGAFGAHALKTRLTPELQATFEVGVRYHAYHALALLGVGLWMRQSPPGSAAVGWLFLSGIVLFSGSLYVLALTGQKWLGMVTPLGGLAFLAGWALWAFNLWKARP